MNFKSLVACVTIVWLWVPAMAWAQSVPNLCDKVGRSPHVGAIHALHDYWYQSNLSAANDMASLGLRAIKLWPREHYLSPDMRDIYEDPRLDVIVIRPLQASTIESPCGIDHWRWENMDYGAIAEHLYDEVGHLSKIIILTGWEQDWQLKGLGCPDSIPTQAEQDDYLALLNARQNGIEQARANNSSKPLQIYHAVEVNHVFNSSFRIIDELIPLMDSLPDFISYSHWSATFEIDDTLAYITSSTGICAYRTILGEVGRTESTSASGYPYIYGSMKEAFDTGASMAFMWSYRDQLNCPKTKGRWLRRCDDSLATSYDALMDLKTEYEF